MKDQDEPIYPLNEAVISKLAYSGKKPESALDHEWLLWYRLRDIYRDVASGVITTEQGKTAKQAAVNSYSAAAALWDMQILLWKRVEPAAVAFAKNPRVETGMALYKALYRMEPAQRKIEEGS